MKRNGNLKLYVLFLLFLVPGTSYPQPEITVIQNFEVEKYPAGIFSPVKSYMAVADSSVFIMEDPQKLPDVKIVTLSKNIPGSIYRLTYSPDGKYLAGAGNSKDIFIWNLSDLDFEQKFMSYSHKLSEHSSNVYNITFSPDSKLLASGGGDSAIIIWDVANGKSIKKITDHRGGITGLAFSPDGKYLASSSTNEHYVRLWESGTWIENTELYYDEVYDRSFHELSFSPDSKYLAGATSAGLDDLIYVWNMISMSRIESLDPHVLFINDIEFSPNGNYLFTSSIDNQLVVFNIWNWNEELRRKAVYDGSIESISFTSDGKYISFGNGKEIFICSIDPPMTPIKQTEGQPSRAKTRR